jgi:hypothetical protein
MAVITLRWARLGAAPFFIWYVTLLDFAEKHRDCKALAFRLTFKEHLPAQRDRTPCALLVCVLMRKETRTEKQRMLPVLLFDGIHTLKQPFPAIDLERLAKEIELCVLDRLKTEQPHAG